MATERAKHAFGTLEKVDSALADGTIDSYDILFVKDANGKPYVGWIDKEGKKVICDDSAEFAEIDKKIATKVSADEVDAKIESALNEIECAPITYEKVKYEIVDAPVGTLVDYRDDEIRIRIPENAQFTKQSVGVGGDPNTYYVTFKTYIYNEDVVGYKETLSGKSDVEILKDLKVDEYGRRYQLTWLGVAKYDEATDTWSYYGANSSINKYIGWDYTLQMYNADDVMIASDSVRINLSNANCHYTVEPYYIGKTKVEVEEMITKAVEDAAGIEVIEF